ncbi:hypothetical protein [Phenylobacterium sp.]|uniref:hypothetical protein n=1 Tax=Phenylobacterium sp. TaxID=1871053 RepID=UPI002CF7AAA6|nr:hypothetical protein [Phenylobacterium sp.]HVI34112.1 hypothetical protein [Phenylobacterium sp.]
MSEDIASSRRDLVARVATLELLVSDLIDLLWKVDPQGMERLANEAGQDLEIQNTRILAAAEHQRERLFTVLAERRRKLRHRRRGVQEDEAALSA